jgi:competence ComEA-like helix-hairpin-helix protein
MKPVLTLGLSLTYLRLVCVFGLALSLISCVTRSQTVRVINDPQPLVANKRININTASSDELEKLPGIGPGLAARIIEHRARYGRFRRIEHLIMVRGLSDRRFRAMRSFVTVE